MNLPTYPIISADDHLDLSYLPEDFWARTMPASMGTKIPHIEERNGVFLWVCDGRSWGRWRGRFSKGDDKPRPVVTALETGGYTFSEILRPSNPEMRIADMERDGVYAQVIYGPAMGSMLHDDPMHLFQCYAAYNDSLKEFCSSVPDRLLGVPMLPPEPHAATNEILRLAKMGIWRQVNLQLAQVWPGSIHGSEWEPFWSAIEETGLVLSFHVSIHRISKDNPAFNKIASVFEPAKSTMLQFIPPFVDLFSFGILEHHPKMRILIAEAGLGWLPWLVQDLDRRFELAYKNKAYWDGLGGKRLTVKPSEIFKRQIFASFQEDDVAITLLPFIGEKNALWASDYPHPDSTWPNSQKRINEQMGHLSDETRKRLLHDNVADLLGLDY